MTTISPAQLRAAAGAVDRRCSMARRYSGTVAIRARWHDGNQMYDCRVSTPEGGTRVAVMPSSELARARAVDSSEAYDAVAKAALSFADGELEERGISLAEHALFEPDGSGWVVARKKAHDVAFG